MSAREPIEPTPEWRNRVEVWLIKCAIVSPDPDEEVNAWLEEAAEGDEIAIGFVLRTWRDLRNLTSSDLERRLAALRAGR